MDQSLDDVIKSKQAVAKAAAVAAKKRGGLAKHHQKRPQTSLHAGNAKNHATRHRHASAARDNSAVDSLGTAEQLGMSLDALIATKRTSVKARPTPVANQGAKLRATAVHGAQTKRQAYWNQKRGLPAAAALPTVTIRNHSTSNQRHRHSHAAAASRPTNDNMLRRVNLGNRRQQHKQPHHPQHANDDDDTPPRLQAWEQHSLDHPTKFNLPDGTNFKISIDLDRVSSVVGINASSADVSLRQ
ncbi:hypothetical protein H257_03745 [Aphanomyces astaci]|uniref:Uncharacterized protein n=1 Tax=Aphanomyces astaci TaxID=112090 RepID=W4GY58_APHAT|nr:hypothetical protein H257_03745 [Aphanomyces astaci]ETV84577.1 hypothetical protein H257_03745 [Aphanomyces astaci]|eukprot:XP_009826269.1 hypothetical protein H257_03745 [Aphanomyces astaci]